MSTTTKLTARRYLVLLVAPCGRFIPDSRDAWPDTFTVAPFDYAADEAHETLADALARAGRLNSNGGRIYAFGLWAIVVRDFDAACPRLPGYLRLDHPERGLTFMRKGGAT